MRKTIASHADLRPGMRVEITLDKTARRVRSPARAPRTLSFRVLRREGDAWLMDPGAGAPSRVRDNAPCYADGRMVMTDGGAR